MTPLVTVASAAQINFHTVLEAGRFEIKVPAGLVSSRPFSLASK